MKIAFDENMPATIVRTFQTIGADKGFKRLFRSRIIVSAKDFTPKPTDPDYLSKNDVPWLTRYRYAGGRVVISGDTRMPEKPHELMALIELGLVTYFLPNVWNNWHFPRKSALILAWLERIFNQSKIARPGALYRIPNDWSEHSQFRAINPPGALRMREMETSIKLRIPSTRRRLKVTETPQELPLIRLLSAEGEQNSEQ